MREAVSWSGGLINMFARRSAKRPRGRRDLDTDNHAAAALQLEPHARVLLVTDAYKSALATLSETDPRISCDSAYPSYSTSEHFGGFVRCKALNALPSML